MKRLHIAHIFFFFTISLQLVVKAQTGSKHLLIKPFENKVFIKEQGQFDRSAKELKIPFQEPVLYGVENAEFNAYFTAHSIIFQFPERKNSEEKDGKKTDGEPEEKSVETIQHTATMQWLNTDPSVKIIAEQEQTSYYNYGGFSDTPNYNFVRAYKKLIYTNLFPGVDAEFELPEEGGIKYRLLVHPNSIVPAIAFKWEGIENCYTDKDENLHIKSLFSPLSVNTAWQLLDHAPNAMTAYTHADIPVKYNVTGNTVQFQFSSEKISSPEGIVIDPWITNPSFPGLNRAFDIQEDAAGNVFVHGNYSQTSSANNYHIQKYNSLGVLQWTYTTYSIFLGDIAVDNPGNVYIIGGYPVGKRQKLNSAGVQLWVLPGLVEEWRLAFNYSKTVLAVCGFFQNPGANNIAQLDMNTGTISNQIAYNEETRSISTDCNGDMYSLHLPTSTLRKTNANFTPAGVVPSGLALIYAGTGYAFNPDYSVPVYQGFNGNVIRGRYVYIYDGITLRRFNKATLTAVNTVVVPNGVNYQCSGLTVDPCGNIYAGTTNSIVKYDSALTYMATIPAPGAVYDIILGSGGNLLACGAGFVGSFSTTCIAPAALTATTTTTPASCGLGGIATIVATGGIPPYTYSWQSGQTTVTSTLTPGTYTYAVNDAFCKTFQGTVTISPIPVTVANFSSTTVCVNTPPTQFTDLSTGASIWSWNFGDPGSGLNNNSILQNPSHTYSASGTYTVTLIAATTNGCPNTFVQVITVNSLPVVTVNSATICVGQQTATLTANGATTYTWNTLATGASINPSPVTTTVYTVVGTGNNTCSTIATSTVTVNPLPIVTVNSATICVGKTTTLTATAANTYTWSPGTGLSATSGASVTASPGTTQTYTVTGTDINACTNTAISTVKVNLLPVVTVNSATICIGKSTTLTATAASTYVWSSTIGLSSVSGTSVTANPTTTTIYTVTGTDINTCTNSATSTVTVNPLPNVNTNPQTTSGCAPLCVNFSNTGTSTGACVWAFGDGTNSTSCIPNHCFTAQGTFYAALTLTDANGCKNTDTARVIVYPVPGADFNATPQPTTIFDATIYFYDATTKAVIVNWNWAFGYPNSSSSASKNPNFTYQNAGSYPVRLLVTSNYGCKDSITKIIKIDEDFMIYVPDAFTPNFDGTNDVFMAKGEGIKDFKMYVFDRWGTQVFYSEDIYKGWDGRYKGTEIAQEDVYAWKIELKTPKGEPRVLKGTVSLLK